MTVNTRRAERRRLHFNAIPDLISEIDRIEAAHRAGAVRTTGNWSPGQIFDHLARFWKGAIDGFPPEMKPPFALRFLARRLIKPKAVVGAATPPGIKLPRKAAAILPAADVPFEDGLASLRSQIERINSGARFTALSPLFGELTHDEWTKLQLGHSALHLGFIHTD